jgi:hypothetical protein
MVVDLDRIATPEIPSITYDAIGAGKQRTQTEQGFASHGGPSDSPIGLGSFYVGSEINTIHMKRRRRDSTTRQNGMSSSLTTQRIVSQSLSCTSMLP